MRSLGVQRWASSRATLRNGSTTAWLCSRRSTSRTQANRSSPASSPSQTIWKPVTTASARSTAAGRSAARSSRVADRAGVWAHGREGEVAGVEEVEVGLGEVDGRVSGPAGLDLGDPEQRDARVGDVVVGHPVGRDVEAVRTRVVVVGRDRRDGSVGQTQGVGADPVEPGDGPAAQVAPGRLADRRHQVVEHGVAPGVLAEVGAQALDEGVLPDVGHQLLEDARALGVGDRVEVRHRLGDVGHLAADRVGRRRHVLPVAAHLAARPGRWPTRR